MYRKIIRNVCVIKRNKVQNHTNPFVLDLGYSRHKNDREMPFQNQWIRRSKIPMIDDDTRHVVIEVLCDTWNWKSTHAKSYESISHESTLPQLIGGFESHGGRDYEILSQHLVRLIRSNRWTISDRSIIQIFKEIHTLTHLALRTARAFFYRITYI